MKTNLVKKILSISIIALVLALVVTTIVLAVVPKRLDNPIAEGYDMITVYQNGLERGYLYDDDKNSKSNEVYSEIARLHSTSLKDNLLSALFQGTLNYELEVVNKNTTNALSVAKAEGTKAIVFTYLGDEKETLKINGKVYKDTSTMTSKTVKFDQIIMPLNNSKNFEQCTIYLVDSSTNRSNYQVRFLAHQSDLYNYIASLDLGVKA